MGRHTVPAHQRLVFLETMKMVDSIKCTPLDLVELKSELDQLQGIRDAACQANRAYEEALAEQERIRVEGELKLSECRRVQDEAITAAHAAFDAATAAANGVLTQCVNEINAANEAALAEVFDKEVAWRTADVICSQQIQYVHDLVDGSTDAIDPSIDPPAA